MAKKRPSLLDVMGKPTDNNVETQINSKEVEVTDTEIMEDRQKGKQPDPNSKRNKWVQLNVFVPLELRNQLKIYAIKKQKDMSDIVVEAIRASIDD